MKVYVITADTQELEYDKKNVYIGVSLTKGGVIDLIKSYDGHTLGEKWFPKKHTDNTRCLWGEDAVAREREDLTHELRKWNLVPKTVNRLVASYRDVDIGRNTFNRLIAGADICDYGSEDNENEYHVSFRVREEEI